MTAGTPPQSPPPGWYDDPSGTDRQRWWDGSSWGEQYRAKPTGNWIPTDRTGGFDDRTWAIFAHASALLAAWVGVAFLGPLVVYLLRRDDSPEVRAHAAAALNFQLSWLIWGIALGVATVVLSFILVGLVFIPVVIIGAIAWLVLTIMASVKASRGGPPMRYPLTIPFVD